jgi:hypothetical protein
MAQSRQLDGDSLRSVICKALRTMPSAHNWSYDNVVNEAVGHMETCDWYRIYDVAEAIFAELARQQGQGTADDFAAESTDFFVERGIGWQMVDGLVEARGNEEIESEVSRAQAAASEAGLITTEGLFRDARRHLSVGPEPESRQAVTSAVSALEAATRHASGESSLTFGQIVAKQPGLFPGALKKVAEGIWGFASEEMRHGREGQEVELSWAIQVVGLCAVLAAGLLERARPPA